MILHAVGITAESAQARSFARPSGYYQPGGHVHFCLRRFDPMHL